MDRSTALDDLGLLCAPTEDPALLPSELERILDRCARPDAAGNLPTNTTAAGDWAANTLVVAGTVIGPGSGRYWRCRVAGTTAASEPTWPTLTGLPVTAHTVTDGGVVWEDAGSTWAPTYDLNKAAAAAWRAKAAKASCRVDVEDQGQRIQRRQVIANCLELAREYARRSAATLTTATGPDQR